VDPRQLQQIGPYRVKRYIAEGGMAWVFEVTDPRFTRARRALKMLKPEAAQGSELQLFHQEEQRLAEVDHPNVVTIFDQGQDPATGCHYYTMNFIEGPTLSQLVAASDALDPEQLGRLFLGALRGVEQIHARNIVHRDIKPSNILVADGDRAVVMDLGIAREAPEADATQYTRTDVIRGTPLYMSPEQSEGRRVNKASDIFSLGLTLYYCLTRRTIYEDTPGVDATNPQSVRNYIGHLSYSNGELDLKLPRSVGRGIQAVVRRACRLDPSQRYQDAREMREALEAALTGTTATGRSRARLLLPVAAAAALGVAGALWAGLVPTEWWGGRPDAERSAPSPTPQAGRPPAASALAVAEEARRLATSAQREAEAAAVDDDAYRRLIAQGADQLAAGRRELGRGSADTARDAFQVAHRLFTQAAAVGPAREARDRARALLDAVERRGGDPGQAAVLFARGQNDFDGGRLEDARATFGESIAALEPLLASANRPPEVVVRLPAAREVVVGRAEPVELSVEARDPDGDVLRYAWSLDGKPRAGDGPSLRLESIDADARVELRIADVGGSERLEEWSLRLRNERPELRIEPRGDVQLTVGGRQRFTAEARDPDGDAVTTEFLLDGRSVAVGDHYDFEARTPGRHTLLVRSRDARGADNSGRRAITVAARAPEPVAPPPPPSPPDPAPSSRPDAVLSDRNALLQALTRYEKALESCDGRALARELRMSSQQQKGYEELCQLGPIRASAEPGTEFGVNGDEGWLCFQFHVVVESDGSFIDVRKKGVYRGELVRRPDGWQFTKVTPGCAGG
jgi:serine/threonine-protein kinase